MRFDTQVSVLRYTLGAPSSLNERPVTWPEVGSVWAAIQPGAAREAVAVDQEQASEEVVLRVRRNALTDALTAADRLGAMGETWRVIGKQRVGGWRRGFWDVKAIRWANEDLDEV